MISDEALEAAFDALGREYGADAYCRDRQYIRTTLEAASPLLPSQKAVESVLDICNVRLDSEHGDPAFVLGWEAALEEAQARINEAINPHTSQGVARVEAMDDALRLYVEGVALATITERSGVSYSGLMKAKKDRGIPNRPQRADGTHRSQA